MSPPSTSWIPSRGARCAASRTWRDCVVPDPPSRKAPRSPTAAPKTAGSSPNPSDRRAAPSVGEELRLPIAADVDVVEARQQGRALAAVAGFSSGEQTVIAAAISEIARNILMYAKKGEVILSL